MSTKVSTTDMIELESLFGPLFNEYFNGVNQVVSKSSTVTAADAPDKRQQQPDSTLASTVTADGNFDVSVNHGGRVIIRGYGSGGDIVVCHGLKGCLDHWILRSSPILPPFPVDLKSPRTTMSTKVPTADMIELESLFGPLIDEYFNGVNQVVSKSSAVTAADAPDRRQRQPDSISSTSTLATTVTADGNFDF
ncbi:hypothetical protein Tco_1347082 [Tanacetum coccineum]